MNRNGIIALLVAAMTYFLGAQNMDRQAEIVGGGNGSQGTCTVQVLVDGVADIQIRGSSATLHNVSGQPPQWRRFQCSGPMPANPGNFQFTRIDGRGKLDLVQDPRNGGTAVVHIEDPEGGSGVYTFDLMWESQPFDGQQTRDFNNNQKDNNGSRNNVQQGPASNIDQQNRESKSERNGNNNRDFNGAQGTPRGDVGGADQVEIEILFLQRSQLRRE
jgi:hypothetical protein